MATVTSKEELEGENDTDTGYHVVDYKTELDYAKIFLQTISTETGDNMYDHLSEVLDKILSERPHNVIDFFEEFSATVKEERFRLKTDHLKDEYIEPMRLESVKQNLPYLKIKEKQPSTEEEFVTDTSEHNLLEIFYYFEKAGVRLPTMELYFIEIAMRELARSEKLQTIRFWGMIYGIKKNYLVLEADLSSEEMEERNTSLMMVEEEEEPYVEPVDVVDDNKSLSDEEDKEKSKPMRPLAPKPVSTFKPIPNAPKELYGEGVNQKIYFVCNETGDCWTELPMVTPEQIVVARQIIAVLSGDLDTTVDAYPLFPGTERHLLRAQIARISAGTQISPLGYYTFDGGERGEGEEEEEEMGEEEDVTGGKDTFKINKNYIPPPMAELVDSSMAFWVHHIPYILPQGRTKWWDPEPKEVPMGEGEEAEEEEEQEEEIEHEEVPSNAEFGPPLLTPCSEDATLESIPAWSASPSSKLMPERTIACVRSNLWPGAYSFCSGKSFDNIYMGWGIKLYAQGFTPLYYGDIQEEYPEGPDTAETTDPTAEEEEAWRKAHEIIPPEHIPEEEEEEEEEDEDDDED